MTKATQATPSACLECTYRYESLHAPATGVPTLRRTCLNGRHGCQTCPNGEAVGAGMPPPGGISFRTYCESTSLHGWQYIYKGKSEWRLFWGGMVLASVIVAFFFVFKQATEFTKATVVTTVDTTTAPLSDVYFPSVTICNINQV